MNSEYIEKAYFDLDATPAQANHVTHFSAVDDPRWAGVVELAPSATYAFDSRSRHDIYVLRGSIDTGDSLLEKDAFAMHCDVGTMTAGPQGARIFVYREGVAASCEARVRVVHAREWRAARAPHMRVAPLSGLGHQLTLVAWEPGARTQDHAHPNGEEIFVLSGELRSHGERYPAGTWLRLHPGARHEPSADVPTLILLRNGHLRAAQARP